MRKPNVTLIIAMALVLAVPCIALAKKGSASSGGKVQYMQYNMSNTYVTSRTSGSTGSPKGTAPTQSGAKR
jgi:acyl-coenzyme A synthetase/AMP-(fatty) acid ligase